MADGKKPTLNPSELNKAILASLENGGRLAEDAHTLLECERAPTAYALALLSQEEFSKSLLLSLVAAGALPWSNDVRHALQDHVCKQLVSVILDYLSPDFDEFLKRTDLSRIGESRPIFPPGVLDAIHIICHERIPRERGRWWLDPGDRSVDPKIAKIAEGRLDGAKQDALYVRIGKTGGVVSLPSSVSSEAAAREIERAERIGQQLRPYQRQPGLGDDLDSEKLIAVFSLLTGRLSPEEYSKYWWVR